MNLAILFTAATVAFSLPSGLLEAICYVESNYEIKAVHRDDGDGNSLGVCQIKLHTARMMGFTGNEAQLMKPSINIHYSAKYLAYQFHRYDSSIEAVGAYNTGSYKISQDGLAVNRLYIKKVFKQWQKKK